MWFFVALCLGGLLALVVANLSSGEKKIEHEIEHLYAVDDPQFVRVDGHAARPPRSLTGNQVTALCNGDEIFPAMLDAIRAAQAHHHFRDLHLLVRRRSARQFADALVRARPRRRRRARAARLGRQQQDGSTPMLAGDGAGRREVVRYHPLALVQPRPAQQPHPPQAAGRRRARRVHRRRRHRRQVARPRAGSRPLARHPLPARGPGRRADAGGVHGQLDRGAGTVLHGADYFPPLAPAGAHAAQVFKQLAERGGSESMRLMYLLAIAVRRAERPDRQRVLRAGPSGVATLVAAAAPGRRACEIIVPGRHMDAQWCARRRAPAGASCSRPASRIYEYQPTMYHTQGDGGGRPVDLGGLDQLRQPLVPAQRRGQPQHPGRRFRRRPGAEFEADKGRSREITLAWWRARPWHERASERLAGLLRSQL